MKDVPQDVHIASSTLATSSARNDQSAAKVKLAEDWRVLISSSQQNLWEGGKIGFDKDDFDHAVLSL